MVALNLVGTGATVRSDAAIGATPHASRPIDEDSWRDLARRRGNAFLLPEWFQAFRRHYTEVEPAIVSIAESGVLRGVMPFVRKGRCLGFAGAKLGDRFGPAAEAANDDRVAAATTAMLGRRDYLVLDHVERGASWPDAIVSATGGRLRRVSTRTDVLPVITLDGLDWDGYLRGRSRNFRSQARGKERRLAKSHDLVYRRTERPEELARDMFTFFELHDARWAARGGSSVSSRRARSFHRDFAASLLDRGWLRLWFLELDGEAVAAWYGWNVGGSYAYCLAGLAPKARELSVGFVLLAHTIREALAEGAREYDFLRGDEAYKDRFANDRREVETVVLAPARSPSLAVARLEAAAWHGSRQMPAPIRDAGSRVYRAVGTLMTTRQNR